MAKRPNLTDINAGFASASKTNANFDEIETAFDNTLSRDGSTPNTMEADLDLNGNDVLNVNALDAGRVTIDGNLVTTTVGEVPAGSITATELAAGAVTFPKIADLLPTRADISGLTVAAAVQAIPTSGYTTSGDGGHALYQRVGAEPSHALKVQSADGAWWELVPDHGVISFIACGGVEGDNAANGAGNVTAFNDFIGYAQTLDNGFTNPTAAPVLAYPQGHYHFDDHLNVKACCIIRGVSGSNQVASRAGTILEFPADSHGIIIHAQGTIDDTTEADTKSGGGTVIERLTVLGGGNTGTTGHGIWMRASAVVRDVLVRDFAQDGLHIVANAGSGGATEGNVNEWRLDQVFAHQNGRHGFYVDDADSNAGLATRVDASSNGRWGIYDSSFLGNTWVGAHVDKNGVSGVGGNPAGASSFVEFGGTLYSANSKATEADLVATQPGTDPTVWIAGKSGSSSSSVPTWQASQPEGTYFHGGPILTDDINARCTFIGTYREPNQGETQLECSTVYLNGHDTSHIHWRDNPGFALLGNAAQQRTDVFGGLHFRLGDTFSHDSPTRDVQYALARKSWHQVANILADGDDSRGLDVAGWDENPGWYVLARHSNSIVGIAVTSELLTRTFGRSTPPSEGEVVFPRGFWFGASGTNNQRHMTNGTAAPTTGEWAQGDFVFNREPSVDGNNMIVIGWSCVSGGTPGTWHPCHVSTVSPAT